jgi:fructokinase
MNNEMQDLTDGQRRGLDVLVVGEALVDVFARPPHPPLVRPGGSPANVAVGLGRLGHRVALLTALGDDANGALLREHLAAAGVQVLSAAASRTSSARVELRLGAAPTYQFDIEWDLTDAPRATQAQWLHVGSLGAVIAPGCEHVRALVAAHPGMVSFDPNCRPAVHPVPRRDIVEELVSRSAVVKLSDEDAAWLYPALSPERVLDELRALGPRIVVVTLGARGALAAVEDERVHVEAAPGRAVIDTVGAGDAFMVGLVSGLLEGVAPGAALARASWTARRTCERPGADLPNRPEWELHCRAS